MKCTDCGSRNLEEDFVRGERSCLDCGLVLAENIIDPGKDWTDFDGEETKPEQAHLLLSCGMTRALYGYPLAQH